MSGNGKDKKRFAKVTVYCEASGQQPLGFSFHSIPADDALEFFEKIRKGKVISHYHDRHAGADIIDRFASDVPAPGALQALQFDLPNGNTQIQYVDPARVIMMDLVLSDESGKNPDKGKIIKPA